MIALIPIVTGVGAAFVIPKHPPDLAPAILLGVSFVVLGTALSLAFML